MLHVVKTDKNVDQTVADLNDAVAAQGFAVLHSYDLKEKMRSKGVDFTRECRVLEVCNPHHAAKVLGSDMRVSMALPCRISVWDEGDGKAVIGMMLPSQMLETFGSDDAMKAVATEVETAMLKMVEQAS